MEDDHRPLVGREALEPSRELVPRLHVICDIAGSGLADVDDVNLDPGPLPVPGGLPVTRADQQAMQPGVELVGVAQAANVLPGTHQRVLDDVLGQRSVAQNQPSRLVQAVRPADRQRRKRVKVALLRSLDKLSLDCRVLKRGLS
jgi:hypothetical protein